MQLFKYVNLILLVFSACNNKTVNKKSENDSAIVSSDYPTVIESLGKKNISSNGNYFMLTKSTDSTVHLTWGNDTLKRMLPNDFDFRAAERLHEHWGNKDYLILQYGTGSGVWINNVLPLNNNEDADEFVNALYFDSVYNLLAIEKYNDTILSVVNLKTKAIQFIIEREHNCEAASNNSCIDSIAIKDRMIYLQWATPSKFSTEKKIFKKNIALKI